MDGSVCGSRLLCGSPCGSLCGAGASQAPHWEINLQCCCQAPSGPRSGQARQGLTDRNLQLMRNQAQERHKPTPCSGFCAVDSAVDILHRWCIADRQHHDVASIELKLQLLGFGRAVDDPAAVYSFKRVIPRIRCPFERNRHQVPPRLIQESLSAQHQPTADGNTHP